MNNNYIVANLSFKRFFIFRLFGRKAKTAGYGGFERLFYDIGPWSCGRIQDGISFRHGYLEGDWVVDFKDLEKIYLKAKEIRIKNETQTQP